jgi:hypothetical protein
VARNRLDDVATIIVRKDGRYFGGYDGSSPASDVTPTPDPTPEEIMGIIYWSADKTWADVYGEITAAVADGDVRPTVYVPTTYEPGDGYGQLPNYTIPPGNYPLAQRCFWDGSRWAQVIVEDGATLDDSSYQWFTLYMRGVHFKTTGSICRSGVTLDLDFRDGGGVSHFGNSVSCFPATTGYSYIELVGASRFEARGTKSVMNIDDAVSDVTIYALGAASFLGSGSTDVIDGTGIIGINGDPIAVTAFALDRIGGSITFTTNGATDNVTLRVYTNATRPSAASVRRGFQIWNSDDNAPNYSDGSSWRDAAGNVT